MISQSGNAQQREKMLRGKWISLEDSRFTIEFRETKYYWYYDKDTT